MSRKCISCFDDDLEVNLQCPASHCLCKPCTDNYLNHCCEQAALSPGKNTYIPLKCPLPECNSLFALAEIASFVSCDQWDKYQKYLILATLAPSSDKEILLTCPECNQYVEVYSAPPEGFWKKLDQKITSGVYLKEKSESTKLRMRKVEIDNLVRDNRQIVEMWYKQEVEHLEIQFSELLEKRLEDACKEELVKEEKIVEDMIQKVLADRKRAALSGQRSNDKDFYKPIGILKKEKMDERKAKITEKLRVEFKERTKKELEEAKAKSKKVRDDMLAQIQNDVRRDYRTAEREFADAMARHAREVRKAANWKKIAADNLSELITPSAADEEEQKPPEPQKNEKQGKSKKGKQKSQASVSRKVKRSHDEKSEPFSVFESNKFFVCKSEECAGGVCLMCMKPIKKRDVEDHDCFQKSPEEMLYNQVLETLAEASTKTCPKCFFPGMKDLQCTHITCFRCDAKWCYHCGRSVEDFPGGDFSEHNGKWTSSEPDDSDYCPMYLQFKYGSNPAKALTNFHLKLQRQAISRIAADASAEDWIKMTTKYFPKGIFDEESLPELEKKTSY
jgi:hypothetical protein